MQKGGDQQATLFKLTSPSRIININGEQRFQSKRLETYNEMGIGVVVSIYFDFGRSCISACSRTRSWIHLKATVKEVRWFTPAGVDGPRLPTGSNNG